MKTQSLLALALLSLSSLLAAEAHKTLPRQDVVEVPAIRAGLCVSNLFQTHMVLQRDKPLKVWGWAAAGEQVTMGTDVTLKDDSEPEMNGFAIAGKDRRFYPAEVRWLTEVGRDNSRKTIKSILVLSSPLVPEPTHYRYAWARNPMANITNNRQVILPAQRSDDWLLEETPLKFPTPPGMSASDAGRQARAQLMKELEINDTERRIQEAEATVISLQEKFTKDKQAWEEAKRTKGAAGYCPIEEPPTRNPMKLSLTRVPNYQLMNSKIFVRSFHPAPRRPRWLTSPSTSPRPMPSCSGRSGTKASTSAAAACGRLAKAACSTSALVTRLIRFTNKPSLCASWRMPLGGNGTKIRAI